MDEKEEPPALGYITPDQLGAFHSARGVKNANCLRCGQDTWKVMSSAEYPALGLPVAENEHEVDTRMFLPTLTLVCSNCATLWQIAMPPVLEWLHRNEKTTD